MQITWLYHLLQTPPVSIELQPGQQQDNRQLLFSIIPDYVLADSLSWLNFVIRRYALHAMLNIVCQDVCAGVACRLSTTTQAFTARDAACMFVKQLLQTCLYLAVI